MKKIGISFLCFLAYTGKAYTQPGYWQQHVNYTMDIHMDVLTNRFTGKQTLQYTNNSPDTLKKVFYHLYWNAFQPGSMMDVHSRELMKVKTSFNLFTDKVQDRIGQLKPDERGYQEVLSLVMNGIPQQYRVDETIMEVFLSKPILPHSTVVFKMTFQAQVSLSIRRSGRDNPQTGVRYSMSQWYPKMCEYDADGWHPTPYVEREFYGVWGKFDVSITIDKKYILGATGALQNAQNIGYGYEKPGTKLSRPAGNQLTWHFIADTVHDFVWTADTGYHHLVKPIPGGPVLHVLYVNHQHQPGVDTSWNNLADAVVNEFPFAQKHFGHYPYRQFSILHGGDGGMEYPTAVLIANPNVGQAFHEMMHNWYYGMLGTNESMYAWMDEGFASYAEDIVWDDYVDWFVDTHPQNTVSRQRRDYFKTRLPLHHAELYDNYFKLVKSGLEEPLTTHADHFSNRVAYDVGEYSKGDIFLEQLGYIVGAATRDRVLLAYYQQWRFKHPDANDFFRVAEKVSGIQLDWYKEYWISSTKTIDYGIDTVYARNDKTVVKLKRNGSVPMPLDILVGFTDGRQEMYYIPQYLMFGIKAAETNVHRTVCEPWKWTELTYILELPYDKRQLKAVEIDPGQRMADVNRKDNKIIIWGD
ncbi:MAG TPA: M1 family metallopeptidase [Chitinophagaceae bacterium]|jgi:hypothetical protein